MHTYVDAMAPVWKKLRAENSHVNDWLSSVDLLSKFLFKLGIAFVVTDGTDPSEQYHGEDQRVQSVFVCGPATETDEGPVNLLPTMWLSTDSGEDGAVVCTSDDCDDDPYNDDNRTSGEHIKQDWVDHVSYVQLEEEKVARCNEYTFAACVYDTKIARFLRDSYASHQDPTDQFMDALQSQGVLEQMLESFVQTNQDPSNRGEATRKELLAKWHGDIRLLRTYIRPAVGAFMSIIHEYGYGGQFFNNVVLKMRLLPAAAAGGGASIQQFAPDPFTTRLLQMLDVLLTQTGNTDRMALARTLVTMGPSKVGEGLIQTQLMPPDAEGALRVANGLTAALQKVDGLMTHAVTEWAKYTWNQLQTNCAGTPSAAPCAVLQHANPTEWGVVRWFLGFPTEQCQ